jgi:hypothetical protein
VADNLPASAAMSAPRGVPYWLEDGTERCGACTHTYVLEMERRCDGCDRGMCDHCVVWVVETREVLCAECRAAEGEEEP